MGKKPPKLAQWASSSTDEQITDIEIKLRKDQALITKTPVEFAAPVVLRQNLMQSVFAKIEYSKTLMVAKFAKAMEFEVEQGLFSLFIPILIGIGIITYFSLPREPSLIALILACVLLSGLSFARAKLPVLGTSCLIMAFVAGGCMIAKLHTDLKNPKMLTRSLTVEVSGVIKKREVRSDGSARYWITVLSYDGRAKPSLPDYIRLTARKNQTIGDIGQRVEGLARLRAPSGSLLPHNYDFAFHNYFEGLGAIGFFMGKPKFLGMPKFLGKPKFLGTPKFLGIPSFFANSNEFSITQSIMKLRMHLRGHIESLLPKNQAGLVTALIIGDRSGIDKADNSALRKSGLAHILAISGLHMALLSATLFFLIRGGLALSPHLVAYHPIKKWAACAALLASTFYLAISGAGIATQRAYIMLGIMLLAIFVNRKALTIRNVALAAFIVLLISPQAIIGPGFQMSFGAVVALVSCYEWLQKRREQRHVDGLDSPSSTQFLHERSLFSRIIISSFKFILGLSLTSLIAGITTGVIGAFHFHQVAPFGLLANVLAMPIVTLITMPLALISVIAIPFALDEPFFYLMGLSVEWVSQIATWVSHIQPSGEVGSIPLLSLSAFMVGLLCFAVFKTKLKLLALPFIALGGVGLLFNTVPIGFISEDGKVIGFVNQADLNLLNPRKGKFQTSNWARAYRLNPSSKPDGYVCDDLGCTYQLSSSKLVAIPKHPDAMIDDCARAAIIVHARYGLPSCNNEKILEITRKDLTQRGTHLIYQTKDGFLAKPTYGRFSRPWTAHRFKQD